MSHLAFTPAPWILGQPSDPDDPDSPTLPVICGNVRSCAFALPVAQVRGFNQADRLANARLIAAAPELLELARCFYSELVVFASKLDQDAQAMAHYDYMIGKIRLTIDQATGSEFTPPSAAQIPGQEAATADHPATDSDSDLAARLYQDAFSRARTPRSPAYKAGVLALLQCKAQGRALASPHYPGTPEQDAWLAGLDEGRLLWQWRQNHLQESAA